MYQTESWLKFLKIADGLADIYSRLGSTCEWDTSAAHAVVLGVSGNERLKLGDDPNRRFSGHSMRIGAAQDLLARSFDIAAIMRAGGWKSVDIVSRYLEQSHQNVWI